MADNSPNLAPGSSHRTLNKNDSVKHFINSVQDNREAYDVF